MHYVILLKSINKAIDKNVNASHREVRQMKSAILTERKEQSITLSENKPDDDKDYDCSQASSAKLISTVSGY